MKKLRMRGKRMITLLLTMVLVLMPAGMATATEPESSMGTILSDSENQTKAGLSTADLTYTAVYEKLIAFKTQPGYTEGTLWTNSTPYSGAGYRWSGGAVAGSSSGVGCWAFTAKLSDSPFDGLPARMLLPGMFTFDDIQVGDILRMEGNKHSVIVLQKSIGGVIVAEANYNKTVHWGRAIGVEEVMLKTDYVLTRYPEGFKPIDAGTADDVVASESEEAAGADGTIGWTLTAGGVLTISGNGAIPDYSVNDGRYPSWQEYKDSIRTVVIKKGITKVGDYAFYQYKNLLDVYLDEGVTNIGPSAFYGSGLMSITTPTTLKEIGDDAFNSCANLTSASLAEGLETVGERAFKGCTSLKYIDFPETIAKVGAGAFTSCEQAESVRFKPGTTGVEIGDNAFTQCWRLTTVTLPATLEYLSPAMFSSCVSLQELYIPKTVTRLGVPAGETGDSPFLACSALSKIYFEGMEAEWNKLLTNAVVKATLSNVTIVCNTEFNNPFAIDPNEPTDDMIMDENDSEIDPEHEHTWATEWSSDADYHWHECTTTSGCAIAANIEKDSYGQHTFAANSETNEEVCSICGYKKGGSSSGDETGSGSGDSGTGDGSEDTGDDTAASPSPSPGNSGGTGNIGGSGGSSGSSGSGSSGGAGSGNGTYVPSTPAASPSLAPTTSLHPTTTPNATLTPAATPSVQPSIMPTLEPSEMPTASETPGGIVQDPEESAKPSASEKPMATKKPTKAEISTAKKAMKADLKTELQSKLNTKVKAKLQNKLKTVMKKSPKKSKKQLKTQLSKTYKAKLKATLKSPLKAEMKKKLKKYQKTLGTKAFDDLFKTQYSKQYKTLFAKTYTKQFNSVYKKLKK